MSAGFYLAIGGALLMVLSLVCLTRPYLKGAAAAMCDAYLIKHGLWDECSGDPMNVWAEEYERRHGLLAGAEAQKGQVS